MFSRLAETWSGWRRTTRGVSDPVAHMFTQDVNTFLIPYRNTKERPIHARFDGPAEDVSVALRTVQSLSSRGLGGASNETEVVLDAVRGVVKHMLWRSYAAFEIGERTSDDDASLAREGHDPVGRQYYPLRAMTYGTLILTPFGAVEIPSASHRRRHESLRAMKLFRMKRTWLIDPPRSLGGRAGLRRVLRRLRRCPLTLPEWAVASLAHEQPLVRFDISEYSRLRAAHQAVAAGEWGWSGRDTSLDHWTEYYLFDRALRFQQALAELRQHVVAEINQLLKRRLSLDVLIRLEGLPSADEVARLRERMATGEISAGEAYDQAR